MKALKQRLGAYARLVRLHQPIGFFLLLWPALWGLWAAAATQGQNLPPGRLIAIFIAGAFVMRCAGCICNDLCDRGFDGQVLRTQQRPLVTGEVTVTGAVGLLLGLLAVAAWLVWQLNPLTRWLALGGAILTIVYPLSKRVTHFPQLILGVVFGGWSVLMAFAALVAAFPLPAWLLFLAATLWPIAYDTFCALVDAPYDQQIGVKSLALWLQRRGHTQVAIVAVQGVMGLLLVAVGATLSFKAGYYLMLGIGLILIIYQHHLFNKQQPQAYFSAFLHNGWLGGVLFLGFCLG